MVRKIIFIFGVLGLIAVCELSTRRVFARAGSSGLNTPEPNAVWEQHLQKIRTETREPDAGAFSSTKLAIYGSGGIYLLLILTIYLLSWRTGRPEASQEGGTFVLRLSWPHRILIWFTGLVCLAHNYLSLHFPLGPVAHYPFLVWLYAFSGIITACGLLQLPFLRIAFDESNIYRYSLWSGLRTVPWADVRSCRLSKLSLCYVLRTAAGSRLHVPRSLHGTQSIIERANWHLQPRVFSPREYLAELQVI